MKAWMIVLFAWIALWLAATLASAREPAPTPDAERFSQWVYCYWEGHQNLMAWVLPTARIREDTENDEYEFVGCEPPLFQCKPIAVPRSTCLILNEHKDVIPGAYPLYMSVGP